MDELYLPVLSHFENGNAWTGSAGRLRYRMTPAETQISAEIWEGPFCYAFSRVEAQQDFPLNEQGLLDMAAWVSAQSPAMNDRPAKSFAQTLAQRDAVQQSN